MGLIWNLIREDAYEDLSRREIRLFTPYRQSRSVYIDFQNRQEDSIDLIGILAEEVINQIKNQSRPSSTAMPADYEALKRDIAWLKQHYEASPDMVYEVAALRKEVECLRKEQVQTVSPASVAALEKELEALKVAPHAIVQEDKGALNKQASALLEKTAALATQVDTLQSSNTGLVAQVSTLQEKTTALKMQVSILQEENAVLKSNLENIARTAMERIKALQEQVVALQKVQTMAPIVPELEVAPPTTIVADEPQKVAPSREEVILHITNEAGLEAYFEGAMNTQAVEEYLEANGENGAPYLRQIQQYKNELLKVKNKIGEVDEETTEEVAEKVVKCVHKRFNNIFLNCSRTAPGKEKYEFFKGLEKKIESYLDSIYLYKKEFTVGQKLDDDSISYFSEIIHTEANGPTGNKIIKGIDIQPRYLRFIDEDDEENEEIMGGYCEI